MTENICTFHRYARTSESEAWFIILNSESTGTCNLHLNQNKYFNGDIILIKAIDKAQVEFIIQEIETRLIGYEYPREDFALNVYTASKREFYSDTIDPNLLPPVKADLIEQNKMVQTLLSKYQHTRGQLNEHVAIEYFQRLGYISLKTTPKWDALKVDVICESEENTIFCQVKLGSISQRTIKEVVKSISNLTLIPKKLIIAIIADSFPMDIEFIKENLEMEHGYKIWAITKAHVLNALPQYKKALK